jgi:quercetin dioxygenase-like cupin family protein
MQTAPFLFGDEISVEPVAPGVTRKILGFNNQIMMVKVFFEEGSEGYVHRHFHVTVGDETKTLSAGDCFFMEPNISHGAVCKKAGVLIDVFSPMREDFLGEDN